MIMTDDAVSTEMQLSIGDVGFDWITLYHLVARCNIELDEHGKKITKPYTEEDLQRYWEIVNKTDAVHTVNRTPHRIQVKGPGYEFSFGNQGTRPFTKIKLHASRDRKSNLQNMSVNDVTDHLTAAMNDLHTFYGLDVPYDLDLIKVYDAEINITFPILNPFHSYRRILDLMVAAFNGRNSASYRNENDEYETVYVFSGKTKKLKVYDKQAEMVDNLKLDMDFDCDLMRFEITGTEQYLSSITANKPDRSGNRYQLYLKDLDGISLDDFFYKTTRSLLDKMDAFLAENTDFKTTFTRNLGVIFSSAMQKVLRVDPAAYAEQILNSYMFTEMQEYKPALLDIEDLIAAIDQSAIDDACKQQLTDILRDIIRRPDQYNDACSLFIHQRELYEELRTRLTSRYKKYRLDIVTIGDQDEMVWWENPTHYEFTFPEKDEESVYWQLWNHLPHDDNRFHIMRTNNLTPVIYCRVDPKYVTLDAKTCLFEDKEWDQARSIADEPYYERAEQNYEDMLIGMAERMDPLEEY